MGSRHRRETYVTRARLLCQVRVSALSGRHLPSAQAADGERAGASAAYGKDLLRVENHAKALFLYGDRALSIAPRSFDRVIAVLTATSIALTTRRLRRRRPWTVA